MIRAIYMPVGGSVEQTIKCQFCGVYIQAISFESHCKDREHIVSYFKSSDLRVRQFELIADEGMKGLRAR